MTIYQIVEINREQASTKTNNISLHANKENAELKAKSLNEIAIQDSEKRHNEYLKTIYRFFLNVEMEILREYKVVEINVEP